MIGCGYVGLVNACGFANRGHQVVGVERDAGRLSALRSGRTPFYEPGLEEQVAESVARGRLSFTDDCRLGVRDAEFAFLAANTPVDESGRADLSHFWQAAADLAHAVSGQRPIVVVKSTVPVGTSQALGDFLRRQSGDDDRWYVVANPEFLTEGNALRALRECDRIVIGSDDHWALTEVASLYAPFQMPLVATDFATAEMVKYGSNAFLATKISFINELAHLCEQTGADVQTVALGMGLDPRIGLAFLRPGAGFGGSCLPKDTRALARMARDEGLELSIVEAALEANRRQRRAVVHHLREALGSLHGRCIALWGLAFKPNTSDIREAPALDVIDMLLAEGAAVRAYDPQAMDSMRKRRPDVSYAPDTLTALEGADALVLLTEWQEFRLADLAEVRRRLRGNLVLDGRSIWEKQDVEEAGLRYMTIAGWSQREAGAGARRVADSAVQAERLLRAA
jgi:UDPglucose 6-dehydrogenase